MTELRSIKLRLVGTLLVMVLVSACGYAPTAQGTGTQTASPARTNSPSPDQTANWKIYTDAKWGYTIKYPETWFDVSNYGTPDTEKYFSNENVGSPSRMDNAGIYFAISVNGKAGDQCLQRGLANMTVERRSTVTIDGVASTINVLTKDGYGELIVNLLNGSYCYWFVYVFRSTQVRDATEPTALLMLGQTFKFGRPSAPPVS